MQADGLAPERTGVIAYALAAATVFVAFCIDIALHPVIHYVPMISFYLAVVVASRFGGRGPGVFALVLSAIVGNILLVGAQAGAAIITIGTATLVIVGMMIVFFVTAAQEAADVLRRANTRREFLTRATTELGRSLDPQEMLKRLARVAVPTIADVCAVDLADEHGEMRRIAVEHVDPKKLPLVVELLEKYPVGRVLPDVLESGLPRLRETITWNDLQVHARSARQLELFRALVVCSYMCVPIRLGRTTVGAITLAMADSKRRYDAADLAIASTLADRTGVALENARLFRELERAREQTAAERDISDDLRARAELANRAKDEFLAMLGHELRNPLAPIVTTLDLMELRAPGVLERERLVIGRQVKHLVRLVDDLLDISRITRGKVELQRTAIDLADVVGKAVEMTSPLFQQRAHELRVEVPRGLVVDGDPDRLAQVASNLLTNAAKYTERGGKVTVTAAREGGHAVLCVRDTGIGIAPEMLPRVFDVFVQEHQALDRAQGGLGLGLAIVKSLAELHGGSVEARSEGLGRGSEFAVRLPLLAEGVVHAVPPAASAPPAARPARVLVVDDNPDALASLAAGLEQRGFQTYRAADGPSALEVAGRVHPELALLDIGLPEMDGYELARRLRGMPGLEDVKLVAVTGYGQPSDVARSQAAGFAEHLVKPVTLDAIEAVIARMTAHAAGAVA